MQRSSGERVPLTVPDELARVSLVTTFQVNWKQKLARFLLLLRLHAIFVTRNKKVIGSMPSG